MAIANGAISVSLMNPSLSCGFSTAPSGISTAATVPDEPPESPPLPHAASAKENAAAAAIEPMLLLNALLFLFIIFPSVGVSFFPAQTVAFKLSISHTHKKTASNRS
ncbi:MAG: hypothetical protein AAGM33_08590 [Pseudomonadota bacterium]